MRLWSLHPKYLDAKGLVALWREGLLARAVLRGETKGYKNHPQLIRFKTHSEPVQAIDAYLQTVLSEAETRGYSFNKSKIGVEFNVEPITVTTGQIAFEWQHLLLKLSSRSPEIFHRSKNIAVPDYHPIFQVREGEIEAWERAVPQTVRFV
jgi:hypothetical protein